MKRFGIIIVSLLIVCSLALAACSSAAQPTATKAPVTLTIWHGMTGSEADTLTAVVNAFEAANPGIKVTLLAIPFDQLQNKFTTEASSGGGPDLFYGPKDWIGTLANAKLISPLDDISSQVGLNNLIQSTIDADKFNGKTYAFPESSDLMALWVNTSIVKTMPTTSDDLLTLAGQYGLGFNYGFYQAAGLIFAEGGQLFDSNSKCTLDQGTGTADALSWMLQAYGAKGVQSDTNGSNLDAAFKSGKIGMIFNGEWATGDYATAIGAANLAIAAPFTMKPSGKTFAPFLGMKNIFLSANSKGDALSAAIKYLNFSSLATTQAMWAKIGHIPTNASVQISDPIILGFVKQSQSTTYFPNEPEMGAVWTPAGDMITKVLTAGAKPADAVASAVQTINAANNK